MHILAMNSASSSNQKAVITRIFHTLKSRGVDCLGVDGTNNNALHYAVKCRAYELIGLLLAEGIQLNVINDEGHSPLSLSLKGDSTPALTEDNMLLEKPIWLRLLIQGADPNVVYPETTHKFDRHGIKMPKLAKDTSKKGAKNRDSAASAETAQ